MIGQASTLPAGIESLNVPTLCVPPSTAPGAAVGVAVGDALGVAVGVAVGVRTGVGVAVAVGTAVCVGVGVGVGVGLSAPPIQADSGHCGYGVSVTHVVGIFVNEPAAVSAVHPLWPVRKRSGPEPVASKAT